MTASNFVPVIGIVGGVGSGKSAVAKALAARRRIAVIEGDAAGHEVLTEPQIKQLLREQFSAAIFDTNGEVNRATLGRLVFGDGREQNEARQKLEDIVHPGIRRNLAQQIEAAKAAGNVEAILLDAAVMFEAGWNDLCDAVVFVDSPYEIRLDRARKSRGWTEETLNAREASQRSLSWKRNASNDTIDNSGKLADAAAQLGALVDKIAQTGK